MNGRAIDISFLCHNSLKTLLKLANFPLTHLIVERLWMTTTMIVDPIGEEREGVGEVVDVSVSTQYCGEV